MEPSPHLNDYDSHSGSTYELLLQLIPYYLIISILLYLTFDFKSSYKTSTPAIKSVEEGESEEESDEDPPESRSSQYDHDNTIKSGSFYIKYPSIRVGKGWKLRYVRLKRHEISYFKDEAEDSKWVGSLMLMANTTIDKLTPAQCYGKKNGMIVKTDSKSLIAYFLFSDDRDKWVAAISHNIECLRDRLSPIPGDNIDMNASSSSLLSLSSTSGSVPSLSSSSMNLSESDPSSKSKKRLSTFRRMTLAVGSAMHYHKKDDITSSSPPPLHDNDSDINPSTPTTTSTSTSAHSSATVHSASVVDMLEKDSSKIVSKRNDSAASILSTDEGSVAISSVVSDHSESSTLLRPKVSSLKHANTDPGDNLKETNELDYVKAASKKKRFRLFTQSDQHSNTAQADNTVGHKNYSNNDLNALQSTPNTTSTTPFLENDSKFLKFLNPGEEIIVSSLVGKKNPIGINHPRQLILTNTPRLFYVDPKEMVMKGEVKWFDDMHTRFEKTNESAFKIDIETRNYKFTDSINGAQFWIDHVQHLCQEIQSKPSTNRTNTSTTSITNSNTSRRSSLSSSGSESGSSTPVTLPSTNTGDFRMTEIP